MSYKSGNWHAPSHRQYFSTNWLLDICPWVFNVWRYVNKHFIKSCSIFIKIFDIWIKFILILIIICLLKIFTISLPCIRRVARGGWKGCKSLHPIFEENLSENFRFVWKITRRSKKCGKQYKKKIGENEIATCPQLYYSTLVFCRKYFCNMEISRKWMGQTRIIKTGQIVYVWKEK